jgi:hypothetical protein
MSDEIVKIDLSGGLNNFITNLQQTYPEIPISDLEVLGNLLLTRAGETLANGERLASVSVVNGKPQIRIWHFDGYEDIGL